jgi:hypothetical protein
MQDGAQSSDLLTHLPRPREDALPIPLWTAERRSERNLLEKDGVGMSEETWLAHVLSFVSSQEKQTLKVPAEKDRVAHNNNVGYKLKDLEADIAKTDPSTFQRFRQAHCTDPWAKRPWRCKRLWPSLKKESAPSKSKESHANESSSSDTSPGKRFSNKSKNPEGSSSNSPNQKPPKILSPEVLKTIDSPTSLPKKKDGTFDTDRTTKWKEGSLRK